MEKEKTNKEQSIIHLDDKYAISVDIMDYSLKKIYISEKTGKTAYKSIGYYGTINGCLKRYLEEVIHDSVETESSISFQDAYKNICLAIQEVKERIDLVFPEYEVTTK